MRSINIFECVGRLVADGRHAESAEAADMINKRALMEGDILNAAELDNVSRVCEDGAAGFLNDAAVSDVNVVSVVNALRNEAAEENENIEEENDEAEIMARSIVHLKDGVFDGGATVCEENKRKAKSNHKNSNNGPNKGNTNARTLDVEHDIFVLLEVDFWKVLRAACVLDL